MKSFHVFLNNIKEFTTTSSRFKTTFDTPIELPGDEKWEVGLKEIAFAYNINTIIDEKIVFGNFIAEHVFKEAKAPTLQRAKDGLRDGSKYGDIRRPYNTLIWDTPQFKFIVEKGEGNKRITKIVSKIDEINIQFHPRMAEYYGLKESTSTNSWFSWFKENADAIDNDGLTIDFNVVMKKAGDIFYGTPVEHTDNDELIIAFTDFSGSVGEMFSMLVAVVVPIHSNGAVPSNNSNKTKTVLNTKQIQHGNRIQPTTKAIKPGHYANINLLLQELNKNTANMNFFSLFDNKVVITSGTCGLVIDEMLSFILGFDGRTIFKSGTVAEALYRPNLTRGIYTLYVYSDINADVRVNNSTKPLLRSVHFNPGKYGEIVNQTYVNPIFVPVTTYKIKDLEISIKDTMGHDILFKDGNTNVTLEFRRL